MKRIVTAAIFVLAAASLGLAQPAPPPGPPGPHHAPKGDPLADYLALTPDQKTQWDAARTAFEAATKPLRDHADATQEQLEQLLDSKSNDAAAIGTLMIDIRNTRDQIKTAHDALDARLEALLTAEQRTKFEAFRAAAPPRPPHPPRH
jgi:Spy/CpxP family protein refolding chaperone